MINPLKYLWLFLISFFALPISSAGQCICPQIGFEGGNVGCAKLLSGENLGDGDVIWTSSGYFLLGDDQHAITNDGEFDEIASSNCANNLSKVPPGKSHALRLGDLSSGSKAAGAEFNLKVQQCSELLLVNYAVILEDPSNSHPDGQLPSFEIDISDNTICGDYQVTVQPAIADFENCSGGYKVRQWTSLAIDLSDHIGNDITIRFQSLDCAWGGHKALSYITAETKELEISSNICSGEDLVLIAPDGFSSYNWLNQNNGTNQQTQAYNTSNLTGGEILNLTLESDANCTASFTYQVPDLSEPVDIVIENDPSYTICQGESVSVTISGADYVTINGVQFSLPLSLSPFSSNSYNIIAHSFSECVDPVSASFNISVIPQPSFNLSATETYVCSGSNVTIQYNQSSGVDYDWVGLNFNGTALDTMITTTSTFVVLATTNEGCTSQDEITVYVLNEDGIEYELPDLYACYPGEQIPIFIPVENVDSLFVSNLQYFSEDWMPGDGISNNRRIDNLGFKIYPQENFDLYLRFKAGSCEELLDTIQVIVNDNPPSIDNTDTDIFTCSNDTLEVIISGSFDNLIITPASIGQIIDNKLIIPILTNSLIFDVEAQSDDCTSIATQFKVFVNDEVQYEVVADTSICEGEEYSITIEDTQNIGLSVFWPSQNFTGSSFTSSISSSDYVVFEVSGPNRCTSIDSVFINVLADEIIEYFIQDTIIICEGTSTVIGVQTQASVFWPAQQVNTNTINVNPTSSSNYDLILTSQSTCTTLNLSVFVDVETSQAILDPINDIFLCEGDSILIEPSGSNISKVLWQTDGGSSDTVSSSLYLPIDTFSHYTLFATSAIEEVCTPVPIQFNVNISKRPLVSFEIEGGSCIGDTSVVSLVVEPFSNTSFVWSDNGSSDNPREFIISDEIESISISLTDSIGCEYEYDLDLNSGMQSTSPMYNSGPLFSCSSSISIDLDASQFDQVIWTHAAIVSDNFSANISSDTIFYFTLSNECTSISDSISVSLIPDVIFDTIYTCSSLNEYLLPIGPFDSIFWQELDTTTFTLSPININLNSLNYTSYWNTCTVAGQLALLNNVASPLSLSDSIYICKGDSYDILLSDQDTNSPIWSILEDTISLDLDFTYIADSIGEYNLILNYISNQGGCFLKDSVFIKVSPAPNFNIMYSEGACYGDTIQVTLVTDDSNSVIWSDDQSSSNERSFVISEDSLEIDVIFASPNNCILSTEVIISSGMNFGAIVVADTISSCPNESVLISLGELHQGLNSSWVNSNNGGPFNYTDAIDTVFFYNISDSIGCFNLSDSIVVNIAQIPLTNIPDTIVSCNNLLLAPYADNNNIQYYRIIELDSIVESIDSLFYSIANISLELNYANSCIDTVNIFIEPNTEVLILDQYEKNYCDGDVLELVLGQEIIGISNYLPYFNSEVIRIEKDTATIVINAGPDDLAISTLASNGCILIDTLSLEAIYPPIATIDVDPCLQFGTTITPVISQGEDLQYLWSNGVTDSEILIDYSLNDLDSISVSIFNECGETTITQNIEEIVGIVTIPNIFSPNDDGVNDVWAPIISDPDIIDYSLAIYDRWGNLQFQTEDPLIGWNGDKMEVGVYVYRLGYTDQCQGPIVITGDVTIVK